MLVVGGNCNCNGTGGPPFSAELYVYDPVAKTGSWQPTGQPNTTRCNHTATLLTTGQVVITGGTDPNMNTLASVKVYDPTTAMWTLSAPLAAPCSGHTANLLPNGRILEVCGIDAQLFTWDPKTSTGSWQATGSLNATGGYNTATLLRDGRVLLAGGQDLGGNATTSAALYDPASGVWTVAGPLNAARQFQSATLLPTGQLLSVGGVGSLATEVLASAELYDRGLNFQPAWQPVITFVAPLASGGALGVEGSLFRGFSEASGGNGPQNSSTGYPVVQLLRIDNGQSLFVVVDPFAGWTDTTFSSLPLAGFPGGPALVTVYTNGIPSVSSVVVVQQPGGTRQESSAQRPFVVSVAKGM